MLNEISDRGEIPNDPGKPAVNIWGKYDESYKYDDDQFLINKSWSRIRT